MDAHEIANEIYRHAEKLMQKNSMVMQPDYGGPVSLVILQSKMCWEYACPMRYSCRCDTGIRITETKQTLRLETIGVHDQHSHTGGKMYTRKSAREGGGVSHSGSEGSANDESG
jgi:hypothetical protein